MNNKEQDLINFIRNNDILYVIETLNNKCTNYELNNLFEKALIIDEDFDGIGFGGPKYHINYIDRFRTSLELLNYDNLLSILNIYLIYNDDFKNITIKNSFETKKDLIIYLLNNYFLEDNPMGYMMDLYEDLIECIENKDSINLKEIFTNIINNSYALDKQLELPIGYHKEEITNIWFNKRS